MRTRAAACLAAGLLMVSACGVPPRHEPHLLPQFTSVLPLPPGFPPPPAPESNPLTPEKIELGRHLFYEKRLSANGTQSCGSCHQQRLAFCDGLRHAAGSTGQEHFRNTMSLVNVAYRQPLTWANPAVVTLEQQVLIPLTNEHPVEMGMARRLDELPPRIAGDEKYQRMFAAAFPGRPAPITIENITRAIASFERAIVSAESPYDRLVRYGHSHALSPEAWRGLQLFFSARAGCSACHGGLDFATPSGGSVFQNNGLTDAPEEFRIPTLRNVALTAPYMHDGSVGTLAEVVADYAAGGRAARVRGKASPHRDVRPFRATEEERRALVAFLESLTDESVTTNRRFSEPRG